MLLKQSQRNTFFCADFSIQRKTLFDKLTELNVDVLTRNEDYIVKNLLLGQQDFDKDTNKILLGASTDFIIATERFDCPLRYLFIFFLFIFLFIFYLFIFFFFSFL